MKKRRFEVADNVINVDFSPEAPDGGEGSPKRVIMELGTVAYDAVAKEESETGLSKSTVTSRALQVYRLVMEHQRRGGHVVFTDESMGRAEMLIIDDPQAES